MPPTVGTLEAARNPLAIQAVFYSPGVKSHLDLGSNDGRTLRGLDHSTITAVELFEPSVARLRRDGYVEVACQDVREYVRLAVQSGRTWDRVTAFDIIEHLPRADGERLIEELEQIADREVIFFVPVETPEMHRDPAFMAYREQGLAMHPAEQRELQAHLSFWRPEDFTERGYWALLIRDFHGQGFDALVAAKYADPADHEAAVGRLRTHMERVAAARETTPVGSLTGAEPRLDKPLFVSGREHMRFGRDVIIGYGARLECITDYGGRRYQPRLEIGDGTTAEWFLHVGCAGRVSIGRDCIIGGHVSILDHEHGYDLKRQLHGQSLDVGGVVIGDSVFIGEYAFIRKGVHIGDHAVIGAHSVVTRDVPAYAVVVGVPARMIRQREEPLTSIVIVTHDGLEHLKDCLASVEHHTPQRHELVVVDNGSGPELMEWLAGYARERDHVKLAALSENRGFAVGTNRGLSRTTGDYVCLLNDDTVVTEGWLGRMLALLQARPDVGLVGPVSNNVSGPQRVNAGYSDTAEMAAFAAERAGDHRGQGQLVSRLVAFCLVVRREVLDQVGLLDERFGLGNFEDDDYCLRARAMEWKLAVALDSFVHHVGQATFRRAGIDFRAQMERNWELFKEKWGLDLTLLLGASYVADLRREAV